MDDLPDYIGIYAVDSEIGSGSTARVFKAYDERLLRWVAIKVLYNYQHQSLRREACELAKINHPNVVSILDIVELPDSVALVMEYLPGNTLASVMHESASNLEKALQYGIEIAKGLDAIHQAGLVHQDIKPENIFIDANQQLKIGDFGIVLSLERNAKNSDRDEPDGSVEQLDAFSAGSFYSFSPEQIKQQEITAASDLYSLGVLMFNLISGEHPFAASDMSKTLSERLERATPKLNSSSPAVNSLITQMLDKNPQKRPGSAYEVVQRLKTILKHEFNPFTQNTVAPNNAVLVGLREKLEKRKKRIFFSALATCALTIALITWLQWPKPSSYITVLSPDVTSGQDLPDIALIQASVHQATVNVFQSLDEYKLVASSEIPKTPENIPDIQRITAVDQVLYTQLDCALDSCALTFSHWQGTPATLFKQEQIQIPIDRLLFVKDFVQEFLYRWIGATSKNSNENSDVTGTDEREYREFLALNNNYKNQVVNMGEYITQLESLKDSSCSAQEICHVLLLTYRKQFLATRDDTWLQKSRELLNNANNLSTKNRLLSAAVEVELVAQNYQKADKLLVMLESKNVVDDTVKSLRARWYFSQGLTEKAKALFDALVKSRPSAHHLYNYALMLFRTGETDKSLEVLTNLLQRVPEHVRGLELNGIVRYYKGDWQAVVASYEALIALNQGNNATTQSNLGFAFLMNGELSKAVLHLENAIALAPNNPQITINLADSRFMQGNKEHAQVLYQKVVSQILALSAPTQNDLLTLAQAYAQLGHKSDALSVLADAESRGASDPFTLYFLSLVYAILDENAASLAYRKKASAQGVPNSWFDIIWFESLKPAA